MSTRSIIARKIAGTRTYEARYIHSGGSQHGKTLAAHYTHPAVVDALFALGDLSVLGNEIGSAHDAFGERNGLPKRPAGADWCVAYHRDRRDDLTLTTGTSLAKLADQYDAEYAYIWDGAAWATREVLWANGKTSLRAER